MTIHFDAPDFVKVEPDGKSDHFMGRRRRLLHQPAVIYALLAGAIVATALSIIMGGIHEAESYKLESFFS